MGLSSARKLARVARREKQSSRAAYSNSSRGAARDPMLPNPATPGTARKYNFEDVPWKEAEPSNLAKGAATDFNPKAGTVRNFLGAAASNLKSAHGGGWGGVAKQAGMHALRGSVGGGAIGGTTEWAQGGSFWAGAKSGAFNGAVGWSGYRMAGKAVGATSRNPFSKDGLLTKGGEMYGGVSKQVQRIMQVQKDASNVVK
jgi:hypothetical protein